MGRPRRRWEDNIRIDLEEIGVNAGNWVDSAQDRNYWRALVNEPPGSISHGVSCCCCCCYGNRAVKWFGRDHTVSFASRR